MCGKILHHALTSVQLAMQSYAPDGGWGEGPGYWGYATSYNVAMLACLESALGTDFGLSKFPGFDQTALFPLYMTGGGNRCFNFADCSEHAGRSDCLLWLGRRFQFAGRHVAGGRDRAAHRRGDDLVSIAGKRPGRGRACPWTSTGGTSKWPRCAAAGTTRRPSSSASKPARTRSITSIWTSDRSCSTPWASAGPSTWGPTTTTCPVTLAAKRYDYYRLRAEGHNTLVIDPAAGPDQDPQAACGIRRFESKPERAFAIADLTAAYGKRAKQVERGVALVDRRYVIVQDEIEAAAAKIDIWWFMHTPAAVRLEDDGRKAVLALGGKQLEARILEPASARFEIRPAAPLPTSPNPAGQKSNDGIRKLAIHLPGYQGLRLTVAFIPRDGQGEVALPKVRPLAEW